jgi:hypothetical protein
MAGCAGCSLKSCPINSQGMAQTLFSHLFLTDDASNGAPVAISPAIPLQGNKAVLAGLVINISGTDASVVFGIQGSYDGVAWEVPASSTIDLSTFGHTSVAVGSLPYAMIRAVALASSSGSDAKALICASIAVSAQ